MGISKKAIEGILSSTNAVVEGHYQSPSGVCYQRHVRLGKVLECPSHVERLIENLADYFCSKSATRVLCWTEDGAIGAYSLAQQLGILLTCTTPVNGVIQFDEGYTLVEGDRVILLDCHLEDDDEVEKAKEFVNTHGCEVVGVGCLIDMRAFPDSFSDLEVESVYQVSSGGVKTAECPICCKDE